MVFINAPKGKPRVPLAIHRQLRPIHDAVLRRNDCFLYVWFDDHPVERIPWFMLLESCVLPRMERPVPMFSNPEYIQPYFHLSDFNVRTLDETQMSGISGQDIIPPSILLTRMWIDHLITNLNGGFAPPRRINNAMSGSRNVIPQKVNTPLYHDYKLNGTLVIQTPDDLVTEYHMHGMFPRDMDMNLSSFDISMSMNLTLCVDHVIGIASQRVSYADLNSNSDQLRIGVTEILPPGRDQKDDRDLYSDPEDDMGLIIDM